MNDQDYQKYVTEKAKSRGISVQFRHDFYPDGIVRWHETIDSKTGKSIHKSANTHTVVEALDRYKAKK